MCKDCALYFTRLCFTFLKTKTTKNVLSLRKQMENSEVKYLFYKKY
jgi:hypothetical protein